MIRYWFLTRTRLHRRIAELTRQVRALETENTTLAGGPIRREEILRLAETNRALEERLALLQRANMARDRGPR